MKTKYLIYSLLIFLNFDSFCQDLNISDKYKSYFEKTREIPHLHLNKTSFLQGEKIWFQAYVVEQNSNKLHPQTSNLYVSVFDDSGKLKEQHLVKIQNGLGSGNIAIDSSFIKENYYIKASTKWMKNFNEQHSYKQKIKIISKQVKKEKSKTVKEKDFFDFQLFPEGGHYLENALNNISILIKNINNEGILIDKGYILDKNNNTIGSFKTNKFGLGKSSIFINNSESYTFKAELPNGTIITRKTGKTRDIGVLLKTYHKKENLEIVVETNPTTLALLNNKTFKIFIHNTRKFNAVDIKFLKNSTSYILKLQKNKLPKGINIITLFNEEKNAISERLIYNDFDNLSTQILLEKIKSQKDSLQLIFNNTSKETINLSASFLPNTTRAYNNTNNIQSSIILKPYVRGNIENPNYYFNIKNKNRLQDLDLLLLTQGWSRYNWKNIFEKKPKTEFNFEKGIDFTFTYNQKIKKKESVFMYSAKNNLVREFKQNENPLVLKNTFLEKGTKFFFALKVKNNYIKVNPSVSYSSNFLAENINLSNFTSKNSFKELEVSSFKSITDGVNKLDEIIVKTKRDKYKENTYGINTFLTSFKTKNMIVPSGETIFEFLRFKRFNITSDDSGNIFMSRSGYGNSWSATSGSSGDPLLDQRRNLRVYLDGSEITEALWILEGRFTNTFKEIAFGRDPGRVGGVLHLYSYSPTEYSFKNSSFGEYTLPIGFVSSKEYYNPKYPSYIDDTYKKYGSIYFKSFISIAPNSSYKFSIPLNSQNKIKVFVEGISNSGKLVVKDKTINIK